MHENLNPFYDQFKGTQLLDLGIAKELIIWEKVKSCVAFLKSITIEFDKNGTYLKYFHTVQILSEKKIKKSDATTILKFLTVISFRFSLRTQKVTEYMNRRNRQNQQLWRMLSITCTDHAAVIYKRRCRVGNDTK